MPQAGRAAGDAGIGEGCGRARLSGQADHPKIPGRRWRTRHGSGRRRVTAGLLWRGTAAGAVPGHDGIVIKRPVAGNGDAMPIPVVMDGCALDNRVAAIRLDAIAVVACILTTAEDVPTTVPVDPVAISALCRRAMTARRARSM